MQDSVLCILFEISFHFPRKSKFCSRYICWGIVETKQNFPVTNRTFVVVVALFLFFVTVDSWCISASFE